MGWEKKRPSTGPGRKDWTANHSWEDSRGLAAEVKGKTSHRVVAQAGREVQAYLEHVSLNGCAFAVTSAGGVHQPQWRHRCSTEVNVAVAVRPLAKCVDCCFLAAFD